MNILLLGSTGTIGKPLKALLEKDNVSFCPTSEEFSSHKDRSECVDKVLEYIWQEDNSWTKIDLLINLAAVKTNIALNKEKPVNIYEDTVRIGMNAFHLAHFYKIPRVLQFVCSCSYGEAKLLKEENFDKTPPHNSVLAHAQAKRQLYYMGQFYRRQYGIVTNTLCVNNVYGGFDYNGLTGYIDATNLKVLDALFAKIRYAKQYNQPEVTIWGTGKPKREFVYYYDIARAIAEIVKTDNLPELLNIGDQTDISIADLAQVIKEVVGYEGELIFDTSKPDGQMKKLLDSSRFRELFPHFEFTSLEDGIEKMVEEYS